MNQFPQISVVTPLYNRINEIDRVWESLNNQIYTDFEWIIIDDGSDDHPYSKIQSYIKKSTFPIIYYAFEKNKGKHIAINKALDIAKGKFFIIADSDDAFTDDAFSFFINAWESIPKNIKNDFCGIRTCCSDQFGNRVSNVLPYEPMDTSMTEVFYKYNFREESWNMVLTKWHSQFRYPEDHTGYFPEGVIWKSMSKNKKLRFFNKINRIYFIENSTGSIMREKKLPTQKISRNLILSRDVLNNDINYLYFDLHWFLRNSILYSAYSFLNKSFCKSFTELTNYKSKTLVIICFPFSVIAFLVLLSKQLMSK